MVQTAIIQPLKSLPGSRGTDIYMKITMLSPPPSACKSPLLPLCMLCTQRHAVPGWHISTHWQIYQGNVHLWWACFYIWDWREDLTSEPKQRREKGTWRQAEHIWQTVSIPHTHTHIYMVCSHSQSQQLALPAMLLRYWCQMHVKQSWH